MKKVITENKLTKKTIVFVYDKTYIKPITIIIYYVINYYNISLKIKEDLLITFH
jgi:hypothetical protein